MLNAEIFGISLPPETNPAMCNVIGVQDFVSETVLDIRDLQKLTSLVSSISPDIIIHMAAQSLVSAGYSDPVNTFSTNVMGTVNLLEASRTALSDKNVLILIVSSDKCYLNNDAERAFKVGDPLGGNDPYSASKAGTEIIYHAYNHSFFSKLPNFRVASARAGNVIGGGDWSLNRLLPDAVRAFSINETLQIRNRYAIRPWQHVIEPIIGYLKLIEKMSFDETFCRSWNFGPSAEFNVNVDRVINIFREFWKQDTFVSYDSNLENFMESKTLTLDCDETFKLLNVQNKMNLDDALSLTAEWYQFASEDHTVSAIKKFTQRQLMDFV